MATLISGLFGGFSGKVGNIVGYKYKGKQCFRRVPAKSSKPATAAQMEQRAKLALAVAFIKPVAGFLNSLPGKEKLKCPRSSTATGMVVRDCLVKDGESLSVNYPSVVLCEGSPVCGAPVLRCTNTEVAFSYFWPLNHQVWPTELFVLIFLPGKGEWITASVPFSGTRAAGKLPITGLQTAAIAEVYVLCLLSNNNVSSSVYAGQLIIPPDPKC